MGHRHYVFIMYIKVDIKARRCLHKEVADVVLLRLRTNCLNANSSRVTKAVAARVKRLPSKAADALMLVSPCNHLYNLGRKKSQRCGRNSSEI